MYCDCMQWFIFHATRLLFALTFDLFFLPLLHILCLLQFLLHLSLLLFNKSLHFFSPILPIPHPCFFPSPQYFSLTSFLHSILDYLLSTCSSLLCSLLLTVRPFMFADFIFFILFYQCAPSAFVNGFLRARR